MKIIKRRLSPWLAAGLALLITTVFQACGANESILKSGKDTPSPTNTAPTVASIEKDIEDMRTADFQFIYVLRRKDGGQLDAEDKGVIRLQTDQANRRVSSDSGKAVVLGSNFQIAPERIKALYDRFAIENYSRPDAVNTAADANVK